jgi:hypothetical protein
MGRFPSCYVFHNTILGAVACLLGMVKSYIKRCLLGMIKPYIKRHLPCDYAGRTCRIFASGFSATTVVPKDLPFSSRFWYEDRMQSISMDQIGRRLVFGGKGRNRQLYVPMACST